MWHDGCDHGDAPMPGLRGLVPHRFFVPLRQAFAQALELYEMTSESTRYVEHLVHRHERTTAHQASPLDGEQPGQAAW